MHANQSPRNDNNPIGQRLKLEMKKRGLSSVDLAKRSDVKTSFIYDIISGKSANPSSVKLARVAESLGVSLTYLAGSSFSEDEGYSFPVPSSLSEYVSIPRLRAENTGSNAKLISREDPHEIYQFRKEWIKSRFGVSPADLRLLSVHGDSMQPTLNHNDTVLVDITAKHPSPPGIFVIFDGMGIAVKRLEYLSHGDSPTLRVMSDNTQYSHYERAASEISVMGRVIWFSREI